MNNRHQPLRELRRNFIAALIMIAVVTAATAIIMTLFNNGGL